MFDPDASRIAGVIDSNPKKVGGYIAISGHPIVAAESLPERDPTTIIIMNPNYEAEIRRTLAEMGLQPQILLLN